MENRLTLKSILFIEICLVPGDIFSFCIGFSVLHSGFSFWFYFIFYLKNSFDWNIIIKKQWRKFLNGIKMIHVLWMFYIEEHSMVMLTSHAFETPYEYLYQKETQTEVTMYTEYLNTVVGYQTNRSLKLKVSYLNYSSFISSLKFLCFLIIESGFIMLLILYEFHYKCLINPTIIILI